jgi:hypothetical protein
MNGKNQREKTKMRRFRKLAIAVAGARLQRR